MIKPYFKSPLHITIFSVEMVLLFGAILTFVLNAIAWCTGYHHGFSPDIDFDFERFFFVTISAFTPIFLIDLIIYLIRKATAYKTITTDK